MCWSRLITMSSFFSKRGFAWTKLLYFLYLSFILISGMVDFHEQITPRLYRPCQTLNSQWYITYVNRCSRFGRIALWNHRNYVNQRVHWNHTVEVIIYFRWGLSWGGAKFGDVIRYPVPTFLIDVHWSNFDIWNRLLTNRQNIANTARLSSNGSFPRLWEKFLTPWAVPY